MRLLIAKLCGLGTVSKVTPILGGLTFIAALQAQAESSPWVDLWRMGVTLGIGIFVTLCGVIWRDLNRRLDEQNRRQEQQHQENVERMQGLTDRQNRTIGALVAMAVAMGQSGSPNGERLAQALQAILD